MAPRTTKKKICTKCREDKPLSAFYYHNQRKWYMESCKECNSATCLKYQQTSGYRERPEYVFYQRAYGMVRTAKSKGLLTDTCTELKEHLLELWERQGGRCFYTNEPMPMTGYPAVEAMTVDRVVPAKGYVRGNLVLCRSIVNRMKQEMPWKDLVKLCRSVIDNEERVKESLRKRPKKHKPRE